MSHQKMQFDTIVALASHPTWHRLESHPLGDAITLQDAHGWEVEAQRLALPNGQILEDHIALVRPDIGQGLVLGVVSDDYSIVSNSRMWETIEKGLRGVPYRVTCAGSVRNCRQCWISLDFPEIQENFASDPWRMNVNAIWSHDGSFSLAIFDSGTRIVCKNTLDYARKGEKTFHLRARHTGDTDTKTAQMAVDLEKLAESRRRFFQDLERMANTPVTFDEAQRFMTGFAAPDGVKKSDDLSTRSKNTLRALMSAFWEGEGNNGQSRYDLLNGITEHWTRNANRSDMAKNFISSEFGTGAARKSEAFHVLNDAERYEKTVQRGAVILAA